MCTYDNFVRLASAGSGVVSCASVIYDLSCGELYEL